MTADVLDSPNMAKDGKKRAISLTLTESYLALLDDLGGDLKRDTGFEPSTSQLVDRAVHEFLERRGKLPLADSKKPRR